MSIRPLPPPTTIANDTIEVPVYRIATCLRCRFHACAITGIFGRVRSSSGVSLIAGKLFRELDDPTASFLGWVAR